MGGGGDEQGGSKEYYDELAFIWLVKYLKAEPNVTERSKQAMYEMVVRALKLPGNYLII